MATFNTKRVIDAIIAADGYYDGDPRVMMIVEYVNMAGHTAWGVTWDKRDTRYLHESESIRNPRILWKAEE